LSELRECLSDYAHDTWSGWMKYMFFVCTNVERNKQDVLFRMPAKAYDRWVRQLGTKYSDLPESEKESDRKEADRILAIVEDHSKVRCTF